MKISDLIEKDGLLCDPNKDFAPHTGKVVGNVKGELIDGMLNGEWVELFENGKIASIINYNKNKMSGNYKTFYSNGNAKEEGKVYDNKWDGLFSNYYENGNLRFSKVIQLCRDENKKRILHKLLINEFKENDIRLISKNPDNEESEKLFISPWTMPGYDFTNLMNQYCIFNMIINGKKSKKNNINEINISESNSLNLVNWEIFNSSISRVIDTLFNKFVIDKLNEYKNKVNQYKSNMISIKKVRKAEKLLGNIYSGFILSVQSYGFFVEISELNVEGLVHVSTLNNDWYEYRSRQNLLIGRKSKKSYKVGDAIEVKIIKVDILKYQIDLELT